MINKKVNLAIAGCGSIVMKRHGPECLKNSDIITVRGFFDINKERALNMANQFGGIVYESFEDILDDEAVDGVLICTANKFHSDMTISSLKKGKHVLCEKPIASTKDDAIKMIDESQKSGKYLMIAHNQRTSAVSRKAKGILNQGTLGKIISFKATFAHKGPDVWSVDKGANTWFLDKASAGLGAIGDLGIHKADLIQWLISDEFKFVTASLCTLDKKDSNGNLIAIEDNGFCIFESPKGICGTLHVSWTNYGACENTTILYCENGTIKIDHESSTIEITDNSERTHTITIDDIESGVVKEFANCILHQIPPEIDGKQGLKALDVVLKCVESSQNKKRIVI